VSSAIGCPHIERLLADAEVSRLVPCMDALNLTFTRQVTRTQRKSDATVTVEGVRLEVPSRFWHLPPLTLRHAGWELSRLVLVTRTGAIPWPICFLRIRRKTPPVGVVPSNRYARPATSNASPEGIPALLRKWSAITPPPGSRRAILP
jgi:putative transposase